MPYIATPSINTVVRGHHSDSANQWQSGHFDHDADRPTPSRNFLFELSPRRPHNTLQLLQSHGPLLSYCKTVTVVRRRGGYCSIRTIDGRPTTRGLLFPQDGRPATRRLSYSRTFRQVHELRRELAAHAIQADELEHSRGSVLHGAAIPLRRVLGSGMGLPEAIDRPGDCQYGDRHHHAAGSGGR